MNYLMTMTLLQSIFFRASPCYRPRATVTRIELAGEWTGT